MSSAREMAVRARDTQIQPKQQDTPDAWLRAGLEALRLAVFALEQADYSAFAPCLRDIERKLLEAAARGVAVECPGQTAEQHPDRCQSLIMALNGIPLDGFRISLQFRLGLPNRVAQLLAYLLANPGVFIDHDDLKRTMAVKSERSSIVKVYICHLRRSLISIGLHDAIVTGRSSYALQKACVPDIIRFVNSASPPPSVVRIS